MSIVRMKNKGQLQSLRNLNTALSEDEIEDEEGDAQAPELNEQFFEKVPAPELREGELEVGFLLAHTGVWLDRKLIFSKDLISLSQPNEDIMIDKIPLAEISAVQVMETVEDEFGESVDQKQYRNSLVIKTVPNGYNSGREYYLRVESKSVCESTVNVLNKLARSSKFRLEANSRFAKSQYKVRKLYFSDSFQFTVAFLILANFLMSVFDAQYERRLRLSNGDNTRLGDIDNTLNIIFAYVFAGELAINLYANWIRRFIRNGWNWFDLAIVSAAFIDLALPDVPDWLVRLMRACRVIRLFGRIQRLRQMIAAVSASLFAMLHCFLILIVIMCIYAILGVALFKQTAPLEFGRFDRAFITLFKIISGDPWPQALPLINEDGSVDAETSSYLCSYSLVVLWVVLQVSQAVLLDNFVVAAERLETAELARRAAEKRALRQFKNPMEPLISRLATGYTNREDLSERIQMLFQALDADGSGSLSCDKFCSAVKKLAFKPSIHMTMIDFASLTQNGALCDSNGCVSQENFEKVMWDQVRRFTLAALSSDARFLSADEELFARRGTLKMLLMDQETLLDNQRRIRELLERNAPIASSVCASSPKTTAASIRSGINTGVGIRRRSSTVLGRRRTFRLRDGLSGHRSRRSRSSEHAAKAQEEIMEVIEKTRDPSGGVSTDSSRARSTPKKFAEVLQRVVGELDVTSNSDKGNTLRLQVWEDREAVQGQPTAGETGESRSFGKEDKSSLSRPEFSLGGQASDELGEAEAMFGSDFDFAEAGANARGGSDNSEQLLVEDLIATAALRTGLPTRTEHSQEPKKAELWQGQQGISYEHRKKGLDIRRTWDEEACRSEGGQPECQATSDRRRDQQRVAADPSKVRAEALALKNRLASHVRSAIRRAISPPPITTTILSVENALPAPGASAPRGRSVRDSAKRSMTKAFPASERSAILSSVEWSGIGPGVGPFNSATSALETTTSRSYRSTAGEGSSGHASATGRGASRERISAASLAVAGSGNLCLPTPETDDDTSPNPPFSGPHSVHERANSSSLPHEAAGKEVNQEVIPLRSQVSPGSPSAGFGGESRNAQLVGAWSLPARSVSHQYPVVGWARPVPLPTTTQIFLARSLRTSASVGASVTSTVRPTSCGDGLVGLEGRIQRALEGVGDYLGNPQAYRHQTVTHMLELLEETNQVLLNGLSRLTADADTLIRDASSSALAAAAAAAAASLRPPSSTISFVHSMPPRRPAPHPPTTTVTSLARCPPSVVGSAEATSGIVSGPRRLRPIALPDAAVLHNHAGGRPAGIPGGGGVVGAATVGGGPGGTVGSGTVGSGAVGGAGGGWGGADLIWVAPPASAAGGDR